MRCIGVLAVVTLVPVSEGIAQVVPLSDTQRASVNAARFGLRTRVAALEKVAADTLYVTAAPAGPYTPSGLTVEHANLGGAGHDQQSMLAGLDSVALQVEASDQLYDALDASSVAVSQLIDVLAAELRRHGLTVADEARFSLWFTIAPVPIASLLPEPLSGYIVAINQQVAGFQEGTLPDGTRGMGWFEVWARNGVSDCQPEFLTCVQDLADEWLRSFIVEWRSANPRLAR